MTFDFGWPHPSDAPESNPAGSPGFARYDSPADTLLGLGQPADSRDWLDYTRLGIGPEHLPDLVRLMSDEDLCYVPRDEPDVAYSWAPTHAARALGELADPRAVEPLLNALAGHSGDEWFSEAVVDGLRFIGAPGAEQVAAFATRMGLPWFSRSVAFEALENMGSDDESVADIAVAAAVHMLANVDWFTENDAWSAVGTLQWLAAADYAPLVRQVFHMGRLPATEFATWADTAAGFEEAAKRLEMPTVEGKPWPRQDPTARLRITLREIEPQVWRELDVPAGTSLLRLHYIIQRAMGWSSYHLYDVVADGQRYADPDLEPETYDDALSLADYSIADLVPAAPGTFVYRYDFGDDWAHDVTVMAYEPSATDRADRLRCTGGARACPPEDCGGPRGYARLLATLSDPTDDDHEHTRAWAGADFDPEHFDLEEVNRRMHGPTLSRPARQGQPAWALTPVPTDAQTIRPRSITRSSSSWPNRG